MKKKLVVLTLALSLSIAGCSNKKPDVAEKVTPTQEAVPTEQTTPTQEAAPTEQTTPTEEATPTQESKPTEETTSADSASAEETAPTEEAGQTDSSKEDQTKELSNLLDELKEHVQIGTAGSSLVQAKYAAKLLDWAAATTLTEDEVKDVVTAWITPIKGDDLSEVTEQLSAVDGAFTELKKDDAQDLLSCAGCEDTGYPWNDTAKGIMDAIMTSALGDARE